MRPRSLLITGPFTNEQLSEFVALMKRMEAGNPQETYSFLIVDSEGKQPPAEMMSLIEKINPLSPGYERVMAVHRFKKPRNREN